MIPKRAHRALLVPPRAPLSRFELQSNIYLIGTVIFDWEKEKPTHTKYISTLLPTYFFDHST